MQPWKKSVKVLFVIYADFEFSLEKIDTSHNNSEKSSTTKINKHTPSGYLLFTRCSIDLTKNKLDCYRSKLCMKIFCLDLRKYMTEIINYGKKEIIPLTDEENKLQFNQKVCYICEKGFSTDDENKKYNKVRDYCHYTGKNRGAASNICNLRYIITKEISVLFHNGSTYDYHFITKELANEFEGQFECLEENNRKYITFSVPIEKELDNCKIIAYKLKSIDIYRFMSSKLSSLVNNLS